MKCLAQGHYTAVVGFDSWTSRSGVRSTTTEPPRPGLIFIKSIFMMLVLFKFLVPDSLELLLCQFLVLNSCSDWFICKFLVPDSNWCFSFQILVPDSSSGVAVLTSMPVPMS